MKKTINHKYNYDLAKMYHLNTLIEQTTFNENAYRNFPEPIHERKHYILKSYPLSVNENIIKEVTLTDSLKSRSSATAFTDESLSFEELSNLLYFSYGYMDNNKRPVPSGGARYPVYLYLAIFNVTGLEKGIYYYNAKENRLELILIDDFNTEMTNYSLYPEMVGQASCLIMHVCSLTNSCSKYGNMGYKLMCIDLGHISQNIYLLSGANRLKCRAILGIYNEYFNSLLHLNPVEESVLLLHALGK